MWRIPPGKYLRMAPVRMLASSRYLLLVVILYDVIRVSGALREVKCMSSQEKWQVELLCQDGHHLNVTAVYYGRATDTDDWCQTHSADQYPSGHPSLILDTQMTEDSRDVCDGQAMCRWSTSHQDADDDLLHHMLIFYVTYECLAEEYDSSNDTAMVVPLTGDDGPQPREVSAALPAPWLRGIISGISAVLLVVAVILVAVILRGLRDQRVKVAALKQAKSSMEMSVRETVDETIVTNSYEGMVNGITMITDPDHVYTQIDVHASENNNYSQGVGVDADAGTAESEPEVHSDDIGYLTQSAIYGMYAGEPRVPDIIPAPHDGGICNPAYGMHARPSVVGEQPWHPRHEGPSVMTHDYLDIIEDVVYREPDDRTGNNNDNIIDSTISARQGNPTYLEIIEPPSVNNDYLQIVENEEPKTGTTAKGNYDDIRRSILRRTSNSRNSDYNRIDSTLIEKTINSHSLALVPGDATEIEQDQPIYAEIGEPLSENDYIKIVDQYVDRGIKQCHVDIHSDAISHKDPSPMTQTHLDLSQTAGAIRSSDYLQPLPSPTDSKHWYYTPNHVDSESEDETETDSHTFQVDVHIESCRL